MSDEAVHPCCLAAARRLPHLGDGDMSYKRAREIERCTHTPDHVKAAQAVLALALQDSESGFFETDYAALEARALLSGDLSIETFEKFMAEADK